MLTNNKTSGVVFVVRSSVCSSHWEERRHTASRPPRINYTHVGDACPTQRAIFAVVNTNQLPWFACLQVRKAAVQAVAVANDTLEVILSRTRDVNEGVRVAALNVIREKVKVQVLPITIRTQLLDQVRKGRFERIILVAGPKILGELRRDLHKEVTEKVVAEADLTLTNHTVDDMAKRIADATTPES